jgi:hypothetical protein
MISRFCPTHVCWPAGPSRVPTPLHEHHTTQLQVESEAIAAEVTAIPAVTACAAGLACIWSQVRTALCCALKLGSQVHTVRCCACTPRHRGTSTSVKCPWLSPSQYALSHWHTGLQSVLWQFTTFKTRVPCCAARHMQDTQPVSCGAHLPQATIAQVTIRLS